MTRGLVFLVVIAAIIIILSLRPSLLVLDTVSAQSNRTFHVTGTPLPATLTSPAVFEGGTTNANVDLNLLTIANTDTANQHTVTIEDCQATPFILFNTYPLAAGQTWIIPLNCTRF